MPDIKSEIKFLNGPQSRWDELRFTINVLIDFVRGFRALHFVGRALHFLVLQDLGKIMSSMP